MACFLAKWAITLSNDKKAGCDWCLKCGSLALSHTIEVGAEGEST